jgi:hypothetical protein
MGSTVGSSTNHLKIEIDAVSEISNGVESLIDTFGDYFRQRLSFIKQSTSHMQRISTFEDEHDEPMLLHRNSSLMEESAEYEN